MDELLTIKEAAKALRLSVHTLRAWTFHRKIPFVRVGRKILFKALDLEKLVEDGVQLPHTEKEETHEPKSYPSGNGQGR